MEPSRISDECSSSESGWTTYLASPMHDYSNYVNEDGKSDYQGHISTRKQENVEENEDGSDDSMASDASSGPSNLEVSYKKSRFFCQNSKKLFSGEKNSKRLEKGGKFGSEKEVRRANADAPTCYSKTAAKVRKDKKMGKK